MRGKGKRSAAALSLVCAVAIAAGGWLAPSAQAQAQAQAQAPAQARQRPVATSPGTEVGSTSVTGPDGRVAQFGIFAAPTDGSEYLWYRTQLRPGGPYGDWQQVASARINFQLPVLSAGVDADGRLEVFTVEYQSAVLVRIHQLTPGGPWSTPQAFGPAGADVPRFFGYPVVFAERDGSLAFFEVYQSGSGTELFVNEQDGHGSWTGFTDLGAGPEPEPVGVPTSVTEAPNGTLTAVAHLWNASSGYYAEISQLTPGGPWGPWHSCATDGCTHG
ncbi:hypothetical protein [Kitasatospora mediocidica]|uniref:hypothetical protein n=1 Tax=Kitasatospora mediocidica TaxID=58352 RepID=UPI00056C4A0B|nr:hypothetical protein [Kitasatospora mediocidica]